MKFLKRRTEIIAEHKRLESEDPHWKALADKGDKLSERPIAFLCDDEVVVVGPCVSKIVSAAEKFETKYKEAVVKMQTEEGIKKVNRYEEEAKSRAQIRHAIDKTKKFLKTNNAKSKELHIPAQMWNALLWTMTDASKDEKGVSSFNVVMTEGGGCE